ncbi:MAG TPA: hypothetical protein VE988_16090 [Gemmataceae bacterium]|nr:hypothetical protein [Gemmataceae bacterium]
MNSQTISFLNYTARFENGQQANIQCYVLFNNPSALRILMGESAGLTPQWSEPLASIPVRTLKLASAELFKIEPNCRPQILAAFNFFVPPIRGIHGRGLGPWPKNLGRCAAAAIPPTQSANALWKVKLCLDMPAIRERRREANRHSVFKCQNSSGPTLLPNKDVSAAGKSKSWPLTLL